MRNEDETAIDYMRRINSALNYEEDSLLYDLPSVEALIEYFELWSVYDTDLMSGILEGIENGESPKPLNDFIKKYKLDWTPQKKGEIKNEYPHQHKNCL